MAMNPKNFPSYVRVEDSILTRKVKVFHEYFTQTLNRNSVETLRKHAWQLDKFYQENKKFKDVEFIPALITILEFVIQKKCGTNWTVARAKTDMRGRFSSRYERTKKPVPISDELSKALKQKIMVNDEALDDITHSRLERQNYPFKS